MYLRDDEPVSKYLRITIYNTEFLFCPPITVLNFIFPQLGFFQAHHFADGKSPAHVCPRMSASSTVYILYSYSDLRTSIQIVQLYLLVRLLISPPLPFQACRKMTAKLIKIARGPQSQCLVDQFWARNMAVQYGGLYGWGSAKIPNCKYGQYVHLRVLCVDICIPQVGYSTISQQIPIQCTCVACVLQDFDIIISLIQHICGFHSCLLRIFRAQYWGLMFNHIFREWGWCEEWGLSHPQKFWSPCIISPLFLLRILHLHELLFLPYNNKTTTDAINISKT